MNKIIAALAATITLCIPVIFAPSASATESHTGPCATSAEANAIELGMRKAKVDSIIDSPGLPGYEHPDADMVRLYPMCNDEKQVVVYYNKRDGLFRATNIFIAYCGGGDCPPPARF